MKTRNLTHSKCFWYKQSTNLTRRSNAGRNGLSRTIPSIIFSQIIITCVSISLAEALNQPFDIYEEHGTFQAPQRCWENSRGELGESSRPPILRGDQTIYMGVRDSTVVSASRLALELPSTHMILHQRLTTASAAQCADCSQDAYSDRHGICVPGHKHSDVISQYVFF